MSKWCEPCNCIQENKFNFCPECGTALEEVEKIKTSLYVHTSKESMGEKGEELGLKDKALDEFAYTGYEIKFEIEVNTKTGDAHALSINGIDLLEPIVI